jgi:hypothetical protein
MFHVLKRCYQHSVMTWAAAQLARAKERQMTKQLLISTLTLLAMTGAAFANGDHGGSVLHVIGHMLSEPDHLAMLSVAGVAAFAIYRLSRRSI